MTLLLLIILLPMATGFVGLIIRSPRILEKLNLICFMLGAGLAIQLAREILARGSIEALGGFLYADALSSLVVCLTAFVALVCSIYAVGYLRQDEREGRITTRLWHRYYVLTPLFVGTMLLSALVNSLGIMWVAIEGTTLTSVLLVRFYNQKSSLEAAWKYIIIGSVGISLALFGTVLAYYSAVKVLGPEVSNGLNWSVLMPLANQFDPAAMKLAFVMILIGYGTKAGLAPMHTWKPDAYAESPIPTAALLGAGFVNCALYAIIRFHMLTAKCLGHAFAGDLLVFFGLSSILVAAPFVLVARNFRRILAYSSIDHAGIMVAALGFGGKLGALGALLHMVFHATIKPLLFFCAGNVQQQFGTPYFRKVTGVIHTLPVTGVLFLMATLAITGTPPFSIFQSEFTALSAALMTGRNWSAAIFIGGVVTIFVGFLLHMARLSLGARSQESAASECPWKLSAMGIVALVAIVLAFWLPPPVFALIQQAAHMIGEIP